MDCVNIGLNVISLKYPGIVHNNKHAIKLKEFLNTEYLELHYLKKNYNNRSNYITWDKFGKQVLRFL